MRPGRRATVLFLASTALAAPATRGTGTEPAWSSPAAGLAVRWVEPHTTATTGAPRILVVRLDPHLFAAEVVTPGPGAGATTARQAATARRLMAVINAGMFAADGTTHNGYLEVRGDVRARSVGKYQSVAAFDPRGPKVRAPFRIFDLDAGGATLATIRRDYGTLLQNLRLIRRPGENRWAPQKRRWSEAALGEDGEGRILLVFARSPSSMHDLARDLLGAGLGLVALQHLEGGPEAQLYVHAGALEIDLVGSYETGFYESDDNQRAWPVPNLLGFRPLASPAQPRGGSPLALVEDPRSTSAGRRR
jgi:hypothetical protein